jgi:hypothetical protein
MGPVARMMVGTNISPRPLTLKSCSYAGVCFRGCLTDGLCQRFDLLPRVTRALRRLWRLRRHNLAATHYT